MGKIGEGVSVVKSDKKEMDAIIDRLEAIVKRLEEALAIEPEEKPPVDEEADVKRGDLVWAKIGGTEVACKVRRLKKDGDVIVKVKDKENKNYGKKFKVPIDSLKKITKE
jgi:hypothetical protein